MGGGQVIISQNFMTKKWFIEYDCNNYSYEGNIFSIPVVRTEKCIIRNSCLEHG